MQKSYTIINNNTILENKSGNNLTVNKNIEEICKKLNMGCGFKGYTPNFIAGPMQEIK